MSFISSISLTFFLIARTYDEYASELSSGHLSWTPVHDSEAFWKENAAKLNERDYEQLRFASPSPRMA